MKLQVNILVAGKTGVGKSTFINYITGENIAKTGAGKPVTGYKLQNYTYEAKGLIYEIYDTWGLEADRASKWERLIMEEVKSRDEMPAIKDWFHTIFYCFSAATARIEAFEIDHILKPLIKSGNNVCIIFTHADIPQAKEKTEAMRQVLLEKVHPNLPMLHVSSERKVLLGGKVVEPFGKENVWNYVKTSLWRDLRRKLPLQVESYTLKQLDLWHDQTATIINRYKHWSRRSVLQRIETELTKEWEDFATSTVSALNQRVQEAIEYYFVLMGRLLNVDETKIRLILEDINKTYRRDSSFLKRDNLFLLLLRINPISGIILKLFQNHFIKKRLAERISNKYTHFKTKIVPEIVQYYTELIDQFEGQLLLMAPNESGS